MTARDNGFAFTPPWIRIKRPSLIGRHIRFNRRRKVVADHDLFRMLLKVFDVNLSGDIRVLEGSVRNENWLVNVNGGRVILKRYKPSLKREQIQHEHAILDYLAGQKFPSPRIMHTRSGSSLVEVDGRYYAVFEYLDDYFQFGEYYYLPDCSDWFLGSMGRTLARLHAHLKDLSSRDSYVDGYNNRTDGRLRDEEWWLEQLDLGIEGSRRVGETQRTPIERELLNQAGWFRERYQAVSEQIATARPQTQLIHGDYGPYNLLVKPGRPLVVVDFELARTDMRVVDLVRALSSTVSVHSKLRPADLEKMRRITGAYLAECPLPDSEVSALPAVWQGSLLLRLFYCWAQYHRDGKPSWLKEIDNQYRNLRWVSANEGILSRLGV